jgi:small subunit ribosomal protein S9
VTEDEKQASEDQQDETPQEEGSDPTTAGPDAASEGPAGGGSAPVLDPSESTPPADEASEVNDSEDDAPAEEPADAPASEHEDEAAEEAPAEVAEEPAADEAAEEPAAEGAEAPAEEAKAEKKKDVIPGADLEPIAVDSGEERPLSAEERARREAEDEERAQREAELVGDGEDEESSAASRAPAKLEKDSRFQATGKRKRSIARVTLLPGDGKFEINGRTIEEFFPRPLHQTMAKQPLATTGYETSVDVRIRVHGGGIGGQAGAVRHGISRALTEIDPELRGELKRRGFLTRDARVKERRKAGLKKARKKPQFSKR